MSAALVERKPLEMSSTNEFTTEANSPISRVRHSSFKSLKNHFEGRKRVESSDQATKFGMRRPEPMINLPRQESASFNKTHRVNACSNPFGYTPYDTGAVKSDFTGMLNSIPRQSSLLWSESKASLKQAPSKFKLESLPEAAEHRESTNTAGERESSFSI